MIGIVTINYCRPKILALFLASITRLRKDMGYFPVVCVSEKEDAIMCQKHNVHHIYQRNNPASEKWNTGVKWLLEQGVDYVMILGSDDIISSELLKNIMAATEKEPDVIGVDAVYFYCSFGPHRGTFLKLQSQKMLGVARTIHRRVLEKVNGNICTNNKSWAMDASVTKTILPHVNSKVIVKGMIVDVKSKKNLNKISYWMSKIKNRLDPQLFYGFCSPEEMRILRSLSSGVS